MSTMHCLKCSGPFTTCKCGGIYCPKCDDADACGRCCFCGSLEHVGKDCQKRAEGEPALRALIDGLVDGEKGKGGTMFIDDSKADLDRRVKEAREHADQIASFSPALAAAIRREADVVAVSMPSLNREGIIRSNGLLHGLAYAACMLLEDRKPDPTK